MKLFKKKNNWRLGITVVIIVLVILIAYAFWPAPKEYKTTDVAQIQKGLNLKYTPVQAELKESLKGTPSRIAPGPNDYSYIVEMTLRPADLVALKEKIAEGNHEVGPGAIINETAIPTYSLELILGRTLDGYFYISPDNKVFIIAHTT